MGTFKNVIAGINTVKDIKRGIELAAEDLSKAKEFVNSAAPSTPTKSFEGKTVITRGGHRIRVADKNIDHATETNSASSRWTLFSYPNGTRLSVYESFDMKGMDNEEYLSYISNYYKDKPAYSIIVNNDKEFTYHHTVDGTNCIVRYKMMDNELVKQMVESTEVPSEMMKYFV